MNKSIFFFLCLILISNCSFSQMKLEIEIIEISNNTGNIMLQLFDKNEKVLIQEKSPIKDKKCSFSISNLNPGKYAVAIIMMKT